MRLPQHHQNSGLQRRSTVAGIGVLASGIARAQSDTTVDLLLVLAVDVSGSVTEDEAELQRGGYCSAMVDADVLAAIAGGETGVIAVAYVEWARYDTRICV